MVIVNDLAGCYARAATEQEALNGLVVAIPAFYNWLSQHDDYTPRLSGPARLQVIHHVHLAPNNMTAWLPDDGEPVNDEDLDWFLAVIRWAYDDLLAAARQRANSPAFEALLNQAVMAQSAFIAFGTGTPSPVFTGSPLERVIAARDAALRAFRATSRSQRAGIYENNGQRWSLRSGLRSSVLIARRAHEELLKL
jgi:hypothetical protein